MKLKDFLKCLPLFVIILFIIIIVLYMSLKDKENYSCNGGRRNNRDGPSPNPDPEPQPPVPQTPADKINNNNNLGGYNGRNPDGSVQVRSDNTNCRQVCYGKNLITKCDDGSIASHSVPYSICCTSVCENNIPIKICGVDNEFSRTIGDEPVTRTDISDEYKCQGNNLVRRQPDANNAENAENRVSYCQANFPNGCQINCPEGQTPACSNGDLRPPGCYCR
jgi:hypothetical protein